MVVNNFLQNQAWGQHKAGTAPNLNKLSGYLGTLYTPVGPSTVVTFFEGEKEREPALEDHFTGQSQIEPFVRKQLEALTYRLSLGEAPGKTGNIDGFIINAQTPTVANQEFAVVHHHEKVPKYFFIIDQDNISPIYRSNETAWTKGTVYLKSNSTSMTFSILLFGEAT